MKHLSAQEVLEIADGQAPDARAAAHLLACPECRRQCEALRGVVRDLAVLPEPPRAWRQATFRRLGLLPRERPRAMRWVWAPALLAGLVLVCILPLRWNGTPEPPAGPSGTGLAQVGAPSSGTASGNRGPVASASMVAHHTTRAVSSTQLATLSRARGVKAKGNFGGRSSQAQVAFGISNVRNNQILPDKEVSLNFALSLPRIGSLTVLVRDDRGGTVATLFDAPAGPGRVDLSWNGAGARRGVYTIVASINGSSVSFRSLII